MIVEEKYNEQMQESLTMQTRIKHSTYRDIQNAILDATMKMYRDRGEKKKKAISNFIYENFDDTELIKNFIGKLFE